MSDGCWAGSGDGERVAKGEAKKAFVFEFGGEDDVEEVEEVMSENVDDSDEVLEPDERDRSDAIPGCRNKSSLQKTKRVLTSRALPSLFNIFRNSFLSSHPPGEFHFLLYFI